MTRPAAFALGVLTALMGVYWGWMAADTAQRRLRGTRRGA